VIVQSVWRSATGWTIGVLRFDSRRGLGIYLFTTVSRTALGPTQPPIKWVPGTLSLGVKRPGHEADHSPPSSAEVKNAWSYTSTPQYVFMAWCLVKHRDNFTFTSNLRVLGNKNSSRYSREIKKKSESVCNIQQYRSFHYLAMNKLSPSCQQKQVSGGCDGNG
jgi:hypothetical protein